MGELIDGLTLAKIRRRDPGALGYGRWHLRNASGALILGDEATGATLDEVEAYLGTAGDGAA